MTILTGSYPEDAPYADLLRQSSMTVMYLTVDSTLDELVAKAHQLLLRLRHVEEC